MKAYNLQTEHAPGLPRHAISVLKSAVLNRTSLEANNNKFYVLEVHEADGCYRLFTNYGRVGADGIKEGRYGACKDEILAEFDRIFREKTSPRKGYVPVEVEKATVGSALRAADRAGVSGEARRQVARCTRTSRGLSSTSTTSPSPNWSAASRRRWAV